MGFSSKLQTAGVIIGILGGAAGLASIVLSVGYHSGSNDQRIEEIENQQNNANKLMNLMSTKLNKESTEAFYLKQKEKLLENQVAELSKKVHEPNQIQQECAELAKQYQTGEQQGAWAVTDDPTAVRAHAAAAMQKICGSRD